MGGREGREGVEDLKLGSVTRVPSRMMHESAWYTRNRTPSVSPTLKFIAAFKQLIGVFKNVFRLF